MSHKIRGKRNGRGGRSYPISVVSYLAIKKEEVAHAGGEGAL